MILIADSGSTKTAWGLVDSNTKEASYIMTGGINPLYQQKHEIIQLLQQELTLGIGNNVDIHFYGAGCISPHVNDIVISALNSVFPGSSVTIETDMMAAARSLCQSNEGIACILGTGSNSCYYDGSNIVTNISPLGYVLGDEGSGAVLGKRFIGDLLKNQLPKSMTHRFLEQYDFTPAQIVESVYKKPFPNRFLAQFTLFIHDHIYEPALKSLVKNCFNEFFNRNIRQYVQAERLPVHFTGSIAFIFKDLLMESAFECGFVTGTITKSPMEGLVRYHVDNNNLVNHDRHK
jgi:glucosamine kinase